MQTDCFPAAHNDELPYLCGASVGYKKAPKAMTLGLKKNKKTTAPPYFLYSGPHNMVNVYYAASCALSSLGISKHEADKILEKAKENLKDREVNQIPIQ